MHHRISVSRGLTLGLITFCSSFAQKRGKNININNFVKGFLPLSVVVSVHNAAILVCQMNTYKRTRLWPCHYPSLPLPGEAREGSPLSVTVSVHNAAILVGKMKTYK